MSPPIITPKKRPVPRTLSEDPYSRLSLFEDPMGFDSNPPNTSTEELDTSLTDGGPGLSIYQQSFGSDAEITINASTLQLGVF